MDKEDEGGGSKDMQVDDVKDKNEGEKKQAEGSGDERPNVTVDHTTKKCMFSQHHTNLVFLH